MKAQTFQNTLLGFLFLIFSISLNAQKTAIETQENPHWLTALDLFQQNQLQSAKVLFSKSLKFPLTEIQEAEAYYYLAKCALELGHPEGGDLMLEFVENYPWSSKQNRAFFDLSIYYFESSDYKTALSYINKVQMSSLSENEKEKYYFQKGYSYFEQGKSKEAITSFKRVEKSKIYGSQAKYYVGYIEYENENYQKANEYFEQVEDNNTYKDKMSYYQADMSFKQGDFSNAIEQGKAALNKSNAQEKSQLNKIIGESYFNLKQYREAIPYLEQYKGEKGKWSNTDFYLLGYAHYMQKDYQNAIGQFNKIINGNDGVAQNAYYHLGESYLNLNQKTQALNAFKNASEMSFDKKIQEDAFYNYAKLSYDIGNPYRSIPNVLNEFLRNYPNTPHKSEMETLLISSYITSKNYKDALVVLEKNMNATNREVYQKVTFYRALELYIEGNNRASYDMLKKSLSTNVNPKFNARALFWKGEIEFQLDQFKEALISFKQFENHSQQKNTPEAQKINYHIGYTYFKLREYENAIPYFQKSVQDYKNDKTHLNDSYLRLADSYFTTAKYWPAMENYNAAIALGSREADYAAYQKAISYGFVDRVPKKIEELNAFINNYKNSQYRDDALFELGNTYTNQNQTAQALATYDELHREFPKSSFASRAILRQGLIYYNANDPNRALEKFQRVTKDFPKTPEAVEAITTAREIYVDLGRVNEYAAWVKSLDFYEVTDAELDNTTYESAEKQYLQNNSKAAISGFQNYLIKFPNGINALKANFYLAQLLFADNLESNALDRYLAVLKYPKNEYSEPSLVRVSEIYLKSDDHNKTIPILKRLENEADFPQNTLYAQSNLMRIYYITNNFNETIAYAQKSLNHPKADNRVKNDASIMMARSYFRTNQMAQAKEWYQTVTKNASGELAAEALYYDAYFKHIEKKYDSSNTAVQKLAKDYAGFLYWGAKGMIIMAKNYYALGDSFQATHILNAISENFTQYPDVVQEAKQELEKIKSEESKRNSSIRN